MAVFTEHSFRRYLDRLIVIHPLRAQSITGVGYDLTVGLYAKVNPRTKAISGVQVCEEPGSARISLEPNSYVIVISREHVYLSSRVAATFHSKSSLAAQAVYLNSTTGDPNWQGRLIFSLFNASGIPVELDVDATFATMVVHDAKRRSRLTPQDSKEVIQKYIRHLGGEAQKAELVAYAWGHNQYTHDFQAKVDRVRRLADVPAPFFQLKLALLCLHDFVISNRLASGFGFAAVVLFLLPVVLPDLFVNPPQLVQVSQVASIISAVVAVANFLRKR